MKLFALMAVMLAFLTGQGNAGIPKATSSVDRLKVLMIGNSFSMCVLEQMPQVAKAMGKELQGRDPWKNENLLTLLCYF